MVGHGSVRPHRLGAVILAVGLVSGCTGQIVVDDDAVLCSEKFPTGRCPDGQVCDDGSCVPEAATCSNGVLDGDETAVDCGGSCSACAPTCSDGLENGTETGIDCGGGCPACAPGCNDGVQNGTETGIDCGGSCAACAPTCTDGVENGSETGIDCGGGCPACAPGCNDGIQNGSETGIDCGGGCAACPTSCTDGIQNGSETGEDCGGPSCPVCPTCSDGVQNGDETGEDCGAPGCPLSPTCSDGLQNGAETGEDCGAPGCPACPTCSDGIQNGDETGEDCGAPGCPICPSCFDGIPNGDETDEDCGGPDCDGCPAPLACDGDLDCADLTCVLGFCMVPGCGDDRQNLDETGENCGGPLCTACAPPEACVFPSDCSTGVCSNGACAAEACTDGVQNGTETDRDCGGDCPADCRLGAGCADDIDCQSGVCQDGECRLTSCGDGILSAGETDTDCGGPLCGDCPGGDSCDNHSDCESGLCISDTCQAASCTDGVLNQDESDADCGGACPDCATGDSCGTGADCLSGVCQDGSCRPAHCDNDAQDSGETGVDCGAGCEGCATGSCSSGADCESGICGGGGTCTASSCGDSFQNGGETGVDCGFVACGTTCGDGEGCATDYDCESHACSQDTGRCLAPACDDLRLNGDETDVDCGGTCGRCDDGEDCLVGADCEDGICAPGTGCAGGGCSCEDATCIDGVKNGDETGQDCGGSCVLLPLPQFCELGDGCNDGSDCDSGFCVGEVCVNPHCTNGVPDTGPGQEETGTDCGGPFCGPCGDTSACNTGDDCLSDVCGVDNSCAGPPTCSCQAPLCDDGFQNGLEIGVDCGGGCDGCPPGTACEDDSDCDSQRCVNGACAASTCDDLVANGNEGDVDCGGGCPERCDDLLGCNIDSDCESELCSGDVCQAPSCSPADVRHNGLETDEDCGGPGCPQCGDTQACRIDEDCLSGVCTGDVCQPAACPDGVTNGQESDQDCGGPDCPDCDNGQICNDGGDCVSGFCNGSGFCADPPAFSCTDGIPNGDETDEDCGGPDCPKCDTDEICTGNDDCLSAHCGGAGPGDVACTDAPASCCQAPRCNDSITNGTESDRDCGDLASLCPRCVPSDTCRTAADCNGGACSGLPVSTCQTPTCGDGVTGPGEVCDDGNTSSCSGACRGDCGELRGPAIPPCGDGFICGGEQCDDFNATTEECAYGVLSCTVCNSSCQQAAGDVDVCGDGVNDGAPNEQCDDSNTVTETCLYGDSDGCVVCNATCQNQNGAMSYCGDTVVDPAHEDCEDSPPNTTTEACAYGDSNGCTVCNAVCRFANGATSFCGDGVVDTGNGENCDGAPFDVPPNAVTENCDYGDVGGCTVCDSACHQLALPGSWCGDGITDGANGEDCDDGDALTGGDDDDECGNDCKRPVCGDGETEGDEECDDDNGENADACTNSCTDARCGDGVRRTIGATETCDGSDLGGASCISQGFSGGTLQCNGTCTGYRTNACTGCGNGLVEGLEDCDDNNTSDPSDDALVGKDCADFGYYTGSLGCNATCDDFVTTSCTGTCGDGIKNGSEQCDQGDLGGANCTTAGLSGGPLGCKPDCSFDTVNCDGCGNGDVEPGEACDGNDFNGATCSSVNPIFDGGDLACNANCSVNTSACTNCGNGVVEEGELCDGAAVPFADCSTEGFTAGTLACNSTCNGYDVSDCSTCGDGVISGDEVCDGNDLDGETCQSQNAAYEGGELACADDCGSFAFGRCNDCQAQNGGAGCASGAVCSTATDGECQCPLYQEACGAVSGVTGGTCVNTRTNPDRCGSCSEVCDPGEVCMAGACLDTCNFPLTECTTGASARKCVDIQTDNNNCGGCNNVCAAGRVCLSGQCKTNSNKTATLTDPDGVDCADGGDILDLNLGVTDCDPTVPGNQTCVPDVLSCTGDLASVSFRFAVCACGNADPGGSNGVFTDGFDSSVGPYDPRCEDGTSCTLGCTSDLDGDGIATCADDLGGGFGVNGSYSTTHAVRVWGTFWWEDPTPAWGYSGAITVKQNLLAGSDLPTGAFRIGRVENGVGRGDAFLQGNASVLPGSYVGSTIFKNTAATVTGFGSPSGDTVPLVTTNTTVDVTDPCDCSANKLINVANIVTAHACTGASGATCLAADVNDNLDIGLNPNIFNGDAGGSSGQLILPCGRFYLNRLKGTNVDVNIVVTGRTALFIGNHVDVQGLNITLQGSAELDVFVKGSLCIGQGLKVGSPHFPSRARVYLSGGTTGSCNGTQAITTPQDLKIAANVYAPFGDLDISGSVDMYGGLFVRNYSPNNDTRVHFDTGVVHASDSCEHCGNDILEPTETCDDALLDGETCVTQGFDGGTLLCTPECDAFDTSFCFECGDDIINGAEACDGEPTAFTCDDLGYDNTAAVGCNADCTLDTSACFVCGDGEIQGGEECDGANLNGNTCVTEGFVDGVIACNANCTLNVDACYECGDSEINPGEQCDGNPVTNLDCADFGYDSGTVTCRPNCTFNTSQCIKCGDLVRQNPPEECDGTQLGGAVCLGRAYTLDGAPASFDGGPLTCTAACLLDTAGCYDCGDGAIEGPEACDPGNGGSIAADLDGLDCADFGFTGICLPSSTVPPCSGGDSLNYGVLACSGGCGFDTTGCLGSAPVCGDGDINPGEECDPGDGAGIPPDLGTLTCQQVGFTGGTLGGCLPNCQRDRSACTTCGDLIAEGDEECDGNDCVDSACDAAGSCAAGGYGDTGILSCNADCTVDTTDCAACGNSNVDGIEECDGGDFNGETCITLGHDGGTLTCFPNQTPDSGNECQFNEAGCTDCDGVVAQGSEQCDGNDLRGATCASLVPGSAGTVTCNANCSYNTTACFVCGDGAIQGTETCDPGNGSNIPPNLGGQSCTSRGHDGGTLTCTASCTLNETGCSDCGDNVLESPEACEHRDTASTADDLFSATCISLGYDGGSVICRPNCTIDDSACFGCGDGLISGTEQCDGTALGGATCVGRTCGAGTCDGGTLSCFPANGPNECQLDTSGCTNCGDNIRQGTEQCDGTAPITTTCAALGFGSSPPTNPTCKLDCTFDTSGCPQSCDNDGVRDPGEQCDGTQLGGQTCSGLGYNGGTLACTNPGCTFNTAGCCGNGVKSGSEQCDGSDLGGQTCVGLGMGFNGGTLACRNSCTFDTSGCYTCLTCNDCLGQACIGGQCGSCQTNADCCSPLECIDGVCQIF